MFKKIWSVTLIAAAVGALGSRPVLADDADDGAAPVFSAPGPGAEHATQKTEYPAPKTERPAPKPAHSKAAARPHHKPVLRAVSRSHPGHVLRSRHVQALAPQRSTVLPEDDSIPDTPPRPPSDSDPWMLLTAVHPAHNPIVVGENSFDVLVIDPATREHITGLRMLAAIYSPTAMTGATLVPVVETGGGHYRFAVDMNVGGPWHVRLTAVDAEKGSVSELLKFSPGSNKRWTQPPDDVDEASP